MIAILSARSLRSLARARTALLAFALVGFACGNNASPLDSPSKQDPWASPQSPPHGKKDHKKDRKSDDKGDKSDFGGVDFQGLLTKIKESLDEPGPYEAPQKSADFDEAKPHWGVM